MNHIIKISVFLSVIFIFQYQSNSAVRLVPVGEDEFDFLYEVFERQETKAHVYFDYQLAPYRIDNSDFEAGPLSFLTPLQNDQLNLFLFGTEYFSAAENRKSNAFEKIRGGFSASPLDKLYLYTGFSLDQRKAENENYTGKKWRGLAGGIDQSFLAYLSPKVELMVGRFASYWGIQRSLVLSGMQAYDGFGYTIHWRKLALSYRLAKLNQLNNALTNSVFENRYLAGHRLDFHVNNKLRIGLFETVIFGGVGRTIELNYINPILFYHSDQLNEDVNDNTFLGLDFTYYPLNGIKLYSQIIIDDYQIEKKTQGDQEPNQYGMIIGAYYTDVMPSIDVRAEYVRITNRTYNQGFERNRYLHQNRSIGYFDNNDFDEITFDVLYWLNRFAKTGIQYSNRKQGEGKITDVWSEPWMDIDGDYSEPFPTGVVEKISTINALIQGFFFDHFYVDGKVGYRSLTNSNHIDSDNFSNLYVEFTISAFFSTSI